MVCRLLHLGILIGWVGPGGDYRYDIDWLVKEGV